jgi:hypothetical protein
LIFRSGFWCYTKAMSNVEFDSDIDNNPRYARRVPAPGALPNQYSQYGQPQVHGGMTGWLVRHGIVSGDSGAKTVLIGIVCINFIAMGFVLYFFVL